MQQGSLTLNEGTALVRRIVALGRQARATAGIRVRQPLPQLVVVVKSFGERAALSLLKEHVLEELNVKRLRFVEEEDESFLGMPARDGDYAVALNTIVTPALLREGRARDLVHQINGARSVAGCRLEERVTACVVGPEWLPEVVSEYGEYIKDETLSKSLSVEVGSPDIIVRVD